MQALDEQRLAKVFRAAVDGQPLAVVTGAAGGIGQGICRALTAAGHAVVATDVNADALGAAYGEDEPHLATMTQDVASEDSWAQLVGRLEGQVGRLDLLVNNAGVLHVSQSIETLTVAEFRRVVDINLTGTFLGIHCCVGLLRRSERPAIVNLSSGEAFHATPGFSGYTSSKWAVRGLTKSAAMELAPEGIRCNSIHPWGIDSGMLRGADGTESVDRLLAGIPMARVGQPDEVGQMVVFLAGATSGFSTGSEFVIDGGASAWSGF